MLPTPPYSLAITSFRFPALAALAGRAPLGGDRELVLGCLMAVRLAAGTTQPHALPLAVRAERSAAARAWFSALGVPASARTAFAKLAEVAGGEDPAAIGEALEQVAELCAPVLDVASRLELERLTAAAASEAETGPPGE